MARFPALEPNDEIGVCEIRMIARVSRSCKWTNWARAHRVNPIRARRALPLETSPCIPVGRPGTIVILFPAIRFAAHGNESSVLLRSSAPILIFALLALGPLAGPAHAAPRGFGPLAPANPVLGPQGTSTMHADSGSSDSTPFAGPGSGAVVVASTSLRSACPSILMGSDGMPVAVCTAIANETPYVHLLDPASGASLAQMELVQSTTSDLAGGIYSYIDDQNRLVLVNAAGELMWITHQQASTGKWQLTVEQSVPIGFDAVVGLVPDYQGRIWFATAAGVAKDRGAAVGYYDPATGAIRHRPLRTGEQIANSISSSPRGVAIASTHALYLFGVGKRGRPVVQWRRAYDRGPARKPGQLSWGTGATPVFFGPRSGYEYVTITDNAVPQENVLVYRARTGRRVCSVPMLGTDNSGTENAPIGSGRSVFVASTYGYPYPASATTGTSSPSTAPFVGGMQRIVVKAAGRGCATAWTNAVRSAAVPRLSLADGLLYTVQLSSTGTYSYTTIDPANGDVVSSAAIGGAASNTLQMVGMITPSGVLYQGTITGFAQVTAGP